MLVPTLEWLHKDSKFSFEFEEENVEVNNIELILKGFYDPIGAPLPSLSLMVIVKLKVL